jgi:cell division septation protein DedD
VRTYVVRPDGTIMESDAASAAPAPAEEPAEAQVASADDGADAPMQPVEVPTTEITGSGEAETIPAEPETTAAVTPAAPVPVEEAPAAETPQPAETAAAEAPQPEASGEADAPVNLLTLAPAAPASPAPEAASAGGFVVQLSSQRSQEQALASFADMQSRYPSILGEYKPVIQQAAVADKGTYFRVRVGPWASRGDAISVCERLQSAGADCFVTQ